MHKLIHKVSLMTVIPIIILSVTACSHSDGSSTSTGGDNAQLSTVKQTGVTKVYHSFDDGSYQGGVKASYSRNDTDNIVIDNITNLMWQDTTEVADGSIVLSVQGAVNYCQNLTLGGFSDWRLPNIEELLNIVDRDNFQPAIDKTYFINTPDAQFYWSDTPTALRVDQTWTLYTEAGTDHYRKSTELHYVRCVRSE